MQWHQSTYLTFPVDGECINLTRITGFGSNVPSPQPVGASITWRANAFDPEGNQVFYRYAINGPSTGGLWKIVREWSTDPNWSWFTSPAELGTTLINVQIRDGYHTSPTDGMTMLWPRSPCLGPISRRP